MSVRFKQVATQAWDINNTYDIGTDVIYGGNSYVSLKSVPKGINIGFTDYWKKITDEIDIESLQNNVEGLQNDVDDLNVTVYGDEEHTGLVDMISSQIYSTTKQKIGKWIDGKDVYRIVLNNITSTSGNYDVDLTSLNIANLIDCKVKVTNTYNTTVYASYYVSSSDKLNYYATDNGTIVTKLTLNSGNSSIYGNVVLILTYTEKED